MVSNFRSERIRAFRIKVFSVIFFTIIFFRLYLDWAGYKISIPVLDPIAFFIKGIIQTVFSFLASLNSGK